jgi:FixJ family two-component response regulator
MGFGMELTSETPTVFIVDDDTSVRRALARLVRRAGWNAEACASAREFIDRYDPAQPGCLVLDVSMPEIDGLELQSRLRELGDPPPIVFLTGHADVAMSVAAMKAGAVNFLTKPASGKDLVDAVREAMARDAEERRGRAVHARARARLASLSTREREVLERVVAGRLNKQIAAELGTAEKTVKVHRACMMRKMQVDSLAELVRLWTANQSPRSS